MNQREKILAGVVGTIVAVVGIGLGVKTVVMKPLKAIDARIKASKVKVETAEAERRKFFAAEDHIKGLAVRTFGDDVEQASSVSGEILTQKILKSGLEEMSFTRLPVPPRILKGAQEIGWSIQGEGPLANVVNLVFALENSPYLHRIESFGLNAGSAPGNVRVRFRFLTLVFTPSPDVQRKELKDKFELDSPERKAYDPLIARDVLRPYVKRPPAPPPVTPGGGGTPAPGSTPAPAGPAAFKVVSLTEWLGQPEVVVMDVNAQKTKRYLPGDELAGGKIVCVDYRLIPHPAKAGLMSESRVILQEGSDFWAIERGATLAEKRKLEPSELPRDVAQLVK